MWIARLLPSAHGLDGGMSVSIQTGFASRHPNPKNQGTLLCDYCRQMVWEEEEKAKELVGKTEPQGCECISSIWLLRS
jgi:hypothetical protein